MMLNVFVYSFAIDLQLLYYCIADRYRISGWFGSCSLASLCISNIIN